MRALTLIGAAGTETSADPHEEAPPPFLLAPGGGATRAALVVTAGLAHVRETCIGSAAGARTNIRRSGEMLNARKAEETPILSFLLRAREHFGQRKVSCDGRAPWSLVSTA